MRYSVYMFFFILLNCKQQSPEINQNDIHEVISISNNDIFNITNNYYILNERYKQPGKHSLMLTKTEIEIIKKAIIDEQLYKLDNSLRFVKSCENKGCLSEMIIHYKSGRKQHFIFDNYLYKRHIRNKSYRKIANTEEIISEIILKKKIDPETVNVYF